MLGTSPEIVALLAVVSAAVSLVAIVAVVVLGLRLRALRSSHRRAFDGVEADVLVELGRHADELGQLRGELAGSRTDQDHLRELLRGTLSRVGMVRYDAFDDMGGALSFSAALLDERSDGVVISAINGRTETRCYAKAIVGGRSEHHLSEEEVEAVDAAIAGRRPSVLPTEGRRRRRVP
jgi:hypothetical protein